MPVAKRLQDPNTKSSAPHTFNLVLATNRALVRSSSQNPNSTAVAWPGLRLLQGKGLLHLGESWL